MDKTGIIKLFIGQVFIHFCLLISINANTWMEEAAEAYEKKDFKKAIELYLKTLENGQESVSLYYNLANCYYRTNQHGNAILYYEKALLLAPNDMDILHNLSVARQLIENPLVPVPVFFLEAWWVNLRNTFSVSSWRFIALFFIWMSLAGFFYWRLGSSRNKRKLGFISGTILFLLSLLPVSLAQSSAYFEKNSGYAILLEDSEELKSAPEQTSNTIQNIYEGYKVKILDQIKAWYKIKLEDGEIGWVPITSLKKI